MQGPTRTCGPFQDLCHPSPTLMRHFLLIALLLPYAALNAGTIYL